MGWNANLVSDKNISVEEITAIVDGIGGFGNLPPSRTDWGWSAAVDIYNPEGNEITIGGSYSMSGDIAESTAEYIKEELEKNGHNINIDYLW